MAYEIRKPKITGKNEREQLAEVKSYLFQLVDDLCFALSLMGGNAEGTEKTNTPTVMTGQQAFNAVKGFIMKSTEIVNAYYTAMGEKLSADYAAKKDFDALIDSMADMTVETGETDGWCYEKTKNGRFSAFGTFIVTQSAVGTALGGLYETETFTCNIPFSAKKAVVSLSADAPFFPCGAMLDEGGETISFKLYSPAEIAANTAVTVRILVTGQMNMTEEVSEDGK